MLLLDEPTAGLDPAQRRAFRQILADHQGGFVVSTHQADDLIDVCDSIAVLVSGRIVFSGSVAAFLDHARADDRRTAEAAFAHFVPEVSH